jgi:hypothetical protein
MPRTRLQVDHEILGSIKDCLRSRLQKRSAVTIAENEVVFPGNGLGSAKVLVL